MSKQGAVADDSLDEFNGCRERERPMRVATYTRVSTSEQPNGFAVQTEAITAEAERRGWSVSAEFVDDGYSAASMARPGITAALEALRAGEADVLVVAKLDRLSRSLEDFAEVLARAQREGWSVVALDADVDTTTPAGEAMVSILSVFAQFERASLANALRTRWLSSGPRVYGSAGRRRLIRQLSRASPPSGRNTFPTVTSLTPLTAMECPRRTVGAVGTPPPFTRWRPARPLSPLRPSEGEGDTG